MCVYILWAHSRCNSANKNLAISNIKFMINPTKPNQITENN